MQVEAQVVTGGDDVVIALGEMDIVFHKPAELGTGSVYVSLFGTGPPVTGMVDSRTIVGALRALEATHERKRVYTEGRHD